MSKVSFYKRQIAPLAYKKHFDAFVAMCIVLIVGAGIGYKWVQHQEKVEREWTAGVAKVNKYQDVVVPRLFRGWSENVVKDDGSIERWSGQDSEVVFIDYIPSCEQFSNRREPLPCWVAYARTKGTARYFKVTAKVDQGDWGIKFEPEHKEIPLKDVVAKAVQLGRDDVVKRLAVNKTDA